MPYRVFVVLEYNKRRILSSDCFSFFAIYANVSIYFMGFLYFDSLFMIVIMIK